MEQAADFYLRLHEEVNAPAKRARDAVRQLSGGLVASRTELARTEAALTRVFRQQMFAKPPKVAQPPAIAAPKALGKGEIAEGVAVGELLAGGLELAAEAAMRVGEAVLEIGARFIEATGEGLIFAQNMRLSFGFLTHDAELGRQTFEDVRHEAQGLALDVHETTDSFRQLLAAQFSIGASHDLVKMAADMQAVGASAEEVQRILYAVREVKDIGSLQQRQVRQLEMAGISGALINKHLQIELGASSPAQVEKLRKGGKIAADVAIKAIEEAVKEKLGESNLGDVAQRMGTQTIAGMFRTAKGAVSNAFITLGEQIEAPATKLASRLFQTFQHVADSPAVQAFGDKFVDTFTRAVDWVDNHWDTIDAAVMKTADVLSGAFSAAVDFVRNHWDDISASFVVGSEILGVVAKDFEMVGHVIGAVAEPIIAVDAWLGRLLVTLTGARDEMGKFLSVAAPILGIAGAVIPGAQAFTGIGAAIPSLVAGFNGAPLASDIVEESKQRQLSNIGPQGSLGPLAANIPEGAVKQIHVGDIHVPVQALDLEDPEGAGTKVGGMIRREILNVLQRG